MLEMWCRTACKQGIVIGAGGTGSGRKKEWGRIGSVLHWVAYGEEQGKPAEHARGKSLRVDADMYSPVEVSIEKSCKTVQAATPLHLKTVLALSRVVDRHLLIRVHKGPALLGWRELLECVHLDNVRGFKVLDVIVGLDLHRPPLINKRVFGYRVQHSQFHMRDISGRRKHHLLMKLAGADRSNIGCVG